MLHLFAPRSRHALTALLALGSAGVLAQTIYRGIDANGRAIFSDIPVATPAKAIPSSAALQPSPSTTATLPYALRQVAAQYPVTLYSAKDCPPCDAGRQLLLNRGVPFSEKTIGTAEDSATLQRLSGGNSLPLLTIGSQQLKGYSDVAWQQTLSGAGYPEKSLLPMNYHNPPPSPLVSQEKPAAPAASAPVTPAAPAPGAGPGNPAGIAF